MTFVGSNFDCLMEVVLLYFQKDLIVTVNGANSNI